MVCATNSNNNNMNMINQQQQQQQQQQQRDYKEEDDDFDMAMDEDDDSEEESSQDGDTSSPPSLNNTSSAPKRPVTQALFLNFTSDLSPQKMNKKKSKPKKQTAYRVNGVNILNRNNLDSKTAIERIQRRRENHNHVERRRRDNINNTIFELSSVVPNAIQPGQKPNKGNILKLSLDYIRDLQAENNALKERLSQYTSTTTLSRPTSISPPLTASTITTPIHHTPPMNTNNNTAAISVIKSVDETPFSNNNSSAPNSPTRYARYHPSSMSVPSSPHQYSNMPTKDNNAPPPLVLPPPRQPIIQQQQQQQQHLQTVFSTMSVSSNTSSTTSTPTLTPSFYHNNNPQQIYIPQPPQLYNNHHHHELFQHQQQKQGLRPLLPATKSQPIIQQPPQQQILPALRMSGYEKIYGNVCRY